MKEAKQKKPWWHVNPWLLTGAGLVGAIALWRRSDIAESTGMVLDFIEKNVFPGNFGGDRGKNPDMVVIHTSEGSADSAISWFGQDHKPAGQGPTSAHYLIGKDGKVYTLVPEGKIAYHAGNWDYNVRSIGIELEGMSANPDNFTVLMLGALVLLVRDICRRYGIPMDRTHIIGHNEVPKQTHTDPGVYFPWPKFMDTLTGGNVA